MSYNLPRSLLPRRLLRVVVVQELLLGFVAFAAVMRTKGDEFERGVMAEEAEIRVHAINTQFFELGKIEQRGEIKRLGITADSHPIDRCVSCSKQKWKGLCGQKWKVFVEDEGVRMEVGGGGWVGECF